LGLSQKETIKGTGEKEMKTETKEVIGLSIIFIIVLTITVLFGHKSISDISNGFDLSYEYRQLDNNCDKSKFILDHKEDVYVGKVVEAKKYYEDFCINSTKLSNYGNR